MDIIKIISNTTLFFFIVVIALSILPVMQQAFLATVNETSETPQIQNPSHIPNQNQTMYYTNNYSDIYKIYR